MISIIISPKFNKENILCIKLKNIDKKNYNNIKLCFSLIYSINFIENAIINKQIGRYYELLLENRDLLRDEETIIRIKLQPNRLNTYNLSCGPEGIFILDQNENLIQSKTEKLSFDKPIKKKIYKEINSKIFNPIIPEPFKTKLSNKFLKNPNKKFFFKNTEMQNVFLLLKKTTERLGINFTENSGIEIKFDRVEMEVDAYKIIIDSNKVQVLSNCYGGSFYALISILQLCYFYSGNLPIGIIEDRVWAII